MTRLPPALLALTPGVLRGGDARGLVDLVDRARRAWSGGLRGVLLREPLLCDREVLELGRALREVLGSELWLGVHDRVHLALALEAGGIHLGYRSLAGDTVRAWFARTAGSAPAIGLSTHATDDPSTWSSADYLFHGPVRDTPSKRGRLDPVGFDGLARAADRAPGPVWALGGLRPEDVGPARRAGAAGVAVLSGILAADDPERAARAYVRAAATDDPAPAGDLE